jgi:hypothetical protein
MLTMDGICGSDYRGGERKSRIRKEKKRVEGPEKRKSD